MKVAIFGSCVTRDLFETPALRPQLALYTSRSSVISVVAPPLALSEASVPLDSAFQRRCVVEDFTKSFFARLAEVEPDWLIVDLIDERFALVETEGTFVTRSLALQDAGIEERLSGRREIPRLTAEAERLFASAVATFAERICVLIPPERVVVHRARWMTHYRDGREKLAFPRARYEYAERHNRALEGMYRELDSALDGRARRLDLGNGYAADPDHRWGLEPYHYEPAYNEQAVARLSELFGRE